MAVSGASLVLVDFQTGFEDPVWGARSTPEAEENARALLAAARAAGSGVVHVRHVSREAGSPLSGAGTAFKSGLAPLAGEAVHEKSVNAAFIGTTLEADLRAAGVRDLVLCGLTTPHCVSTTVRMAANLGFGVRLAGDACAAFACNADVSFDGGAAPSAEAVHRAALAHLHGEFAQVAATREILAGPG